VFNVVCVRNLYHMNHKHTIYQNAQLLNIDSRCYLGLNSIGFEIFKVVSSTKILQHLEQCHVDSCRVQLRILEAAFPLKLSSSSKEFVKRIAIIGQFIVVNGAKVTELQSSDQA